MSPDLLDKGCFPYSNDITVISCDSEKMWSLWSLSFLMLVRMQQTTDLRTNFLTSFNFAKYGFESNAYLIYHLKMTSLIAEIPFITMRNRNLLKSVSWTLKVYFSLLSFSVKSGCLLIKWITLEITTSLRRCSWDFNHKVCVKSLFWK